MNFVLGQVLGEGSAGIVYQGTWNNRVVAIKKFVGQHTRHAEQEMKLLRTLNHPNIIQCFDHQQDRTDTYLIMEFIEGGTLFEYIQRSYDEMNTNSYWYKCKSIANDIAQGMNYLHERNVIHGDLKSHNILLQLNEEQAKICDFGLSKTMSDTRSHMTTPTKRYTSAQGTIRWMAPEICCHPPEKLSRESDVWAYGCILLEITSGDLPWREEFEDDQILFRTLQKQHTDIFTRICSTQRAPPKFRQLLCMCCSWSKSHRPTFTAIVSNLQAISSTDLVKINQPSRTSSSSTLSSKMSSMSIHQQQNDQNEERARKARQQKEDQERLTREERDRRDREERDRRDREERDRRDRTDRERRDREEREWQRQKDERDRLDREQREREENDRQERQRRQQQAVPASRRSTFDDSFSDGDSSSDFPSPFPAFRSGNDGFGSLLAPPSFTMGGSGGGGRSAASHGGHLTGDFYTSRGSANGRAIYEGARGGHYYMTRGGNKRYL